MNADDVVMTVEDVMRRYQFADPRAARRVMDSAGAFKLGARLMIRADRLRQYENDLMNERLAPGRPAVIPPSSGSASRGRTRRVPAREPLGPGWWHDYDPAGQDVAESDN